MFFIFFLTRFIRKEKEIAETKSEMVQSESVRYQQRLEFVEKQLKEAEASLDKERQRSKMSAKDAKEHDEIMEKVEKLGEVEEFNKALVNENEALKNKISKVESQVRQNIILVAWWYLRVILCCGNDHLGTNVYTVIP